MNYSYLDTQLQGRNRNSRKLANNTYAERRDSNIAIRLHQTDILTFKPDGEIVTNTGGWFSSTTKARLNEFLPSGYRIYQNKGQWNWSDGQLFSSGDKLVPAPGGYKLETQAKPTDEKKLQKLRKQILKYSADFAAAVPVDQPSGGDCWYCLMKTTEGKSLGDASQNTSHLRSHMEEKYYVPSMLAAAMKEAGNTDMVTAGCFKQPDGQNAGVWLEGISRNRAKSALRKFLYRRFGLPA